VKNLAAVKDGCLTGLEHGSSSARNTTTERKFGCISKLGVHQNRSLTIDFALHGGY
jgi:hypothetical protein